MAECRNVSVDEPDESDLEASIEGIETTGTTISGVAVVSNQVLSGQGTSDSGTLEITLDGSTVVQESVSVGAGSQQAVEFEITEVSPGQHEVCARMADQQLVAQ